MFNNATKFENRLLEENAGLKREIKKCYIVIDNLEDENKDLREDNLRLSEIEDRYQFLIAELTELKTQLLLLLENKEGVKNE